MRQEDEDMKMTNESSALYELLTDLIKSQSDVLKQLKLAVLILCGSFTLIIIGLIIGFVHYESQFETTETTTTVMETEGENANINSVTNGDMYNDSSVHNE